MKSILILFSVISLTFIKVNGQTDSSIINITISDSYNELIENDSLSMSLDYSTNYYLKLFDKNGKYVIIADYQHKKTFSKKIPKGKYNFKIGDYVADIIDTTILVNLDTLNFELTINTFSKDKIDDIILEAENDIKNKKIQLKWLISSSSSDISCPKMNKISKKYKFKVDCIGSHAYPETIQYINTYNQIVIAFLNQKYSKKEIDEVIYKLLKNWD